jgi:hypothetical protein
MERSAWQSGQVALTLAFGEPVMGMEIMELPHMHACTLNNQVLTTVPYSRDMKTIRLRGRRLI